MNEMAIKSIAPWFGGKRTLAPKIVQELGKHTVYIEPFCGAMSVIMAKPRCRVEIVNDLHGDIINLATVIQDAKLGPAFYRRARRLIVSDDQIAMADDTVRFDEPATMKDGERALAFFATSWMGRNGELGLKSNGSRNLAVRWNANGGDPCTRYRNAVASIPAWRRRLADVTILRRDAFEILESFEDQPESVIYCDPPYLKKSDEYQHDFSDDDHARLANALSRFKRARVLVSYYAHPRIAELYPDWRIVDCSMTKNMGSLAKRNGDKAIAPEILIVNQCDNHGLLFGATR